MADECDQREPSRQKNKIGRHLLHLQERAPDIQDDKVEAF
jgi:hypothetical protein